MRDEREYFLLLSDDGDIYLPMREENTSKKTQYKQLLLCG
jgi:hypothetical protein